MLFRPVPAVEHEFAVRSGARRVFGLEEIIEPEPACAAPADLGTEDLSGAAAGFEYCPVRVVVAEAVRREFIATRRFSRHVEEGGFLAGRVFRGSADQAGFIVKVTAAINAERSGASRHSFTFTGESFLRIGAQIGGPASERLLGWYHTHFSAATDAMGLSPVDIDLHRSTFRLPWQVAGLVNLARDGRVLRFYCMDGQRMVLAPYWVAPR
ncbi:MAG TPA: hypothetical protein VFQ44_11930 [Streptosporangiaceae bacterium]|nr:hypothetical protein [Streptosporangiaceae bacterium]